MKNNERGSTTILALCITLMITLFSLWFLQKMQLNHLLVKKRFETYLCYRAHDQNLKKHINYMRKLNLTIAAAFYGEFIPIPGVGATAKATLEFLKIAQNTYVGVYRLKILKTSHCTKDQNLSYFANYAYQTSGALLARTVDQRAYLKGSTWTNYIYHSSASDRFVLKITYHQPLGKNQLEEIPMHMEVSSWRRYFGLP